MTEQVIEDLSTFLSSLAFSEFKIEAISEQYGFNAVKIILADPYALLKTLPQITFQECDKLATHLAIPKNDMRRIQGAFVSVMQQAVKQGHCGLTRETLCLGANRYCQTDPEYLENGLSALIQAQFFCEMTTDAGEGIFLKSLWVQEKGIADKIKAHLQAVSHHQDKTLTDALGTVIENESMTLSEAQYQAVEEAILAKVFVLTGGPGVGKTTLTRLLAKTFAKKGFQLALCAPTGRAAKRLTEVTDMPASTIHRLLGYDPFNERFQHHLGDPLVLDAIIIDEASMLDVPLCYALLQALPVTTKIIFVGDVDQLPAIGPGDVLRSLLSTHCVPQARLTEIYRQAENSQIVLNAHRVNQGLMPLTDNSPEQDFFVLKTSDIPRQLACLTTLIEERVPIRFDVDAIRDCQILTLKNDGVLGVNSLNNMLQTILNPGVAHKKQVKHFDGVLREGDKVIQIVNNYEKNVFNGDVGIIDSITTKPKTIWVRFDQMQVKYKGKSLKELKLAYALTVHKAQGSEYPVVIVVLSKSQNILLQRKVLYTAMTRGKEGVILLTDNAAIQRAVNNNAKEKRIVTLGALLNDDSTTDKSS